MEWISLVLTLALSLANLVIALAIHKRIAQNKTH